MTGPATIEVEALEAALSAADRRYQGARATLRELRGEERRLFAPSVNARRQECDDLRRQLKALRVPEGAR